MQQGRRESLSTQEKALSLRATPGQRPDQALGAALRASTGAPPPPPPLPLIIRAQRERERALRALRGCNTGRLYMHTLRSGRLQLNWGFVEFPTVRPTAHRCAKDSVQPTRGSKAGSMRSHTTAGRHERRTERTKTRFLFWISDGKVLG